MKPGPLINYKLAMVLASIFVGLHLTNYDYAVSVPGLIISALVACLSWRYLRKGLKAHADKSVWTPVILITLPYIVSVPLAVVAGMSNWTEMVTIDTLNMLFSEKQHITQADEHLNTLLLILFLMMMAIFVAGIEIFRIGRASDLSTKALGITVALILPFTLAFSIIIGAVEIGISMQTIPPPTGGEGLPLVKDFVNFLLLSPYLMLIRYFYLADRLQIRSRNAIASSLG